MGDLFDNPVVVASIISAAGTAIVIPVLRWIGEIVVGARNERRTDINLLIDELKEQIRDQKADLSRLRDENHELRQRVMHLESAREDMPFPMWAKDRSLRYQWINTAYEQDLLKPADKTVNDVINQTDQQIWQDGIDPKIADSIQLATRSGDHRSFVPGVRLGNGSGMTYSVYTFPLYRGTMVTAWMSVAIPELAPLQFRAPPPVELPPVKALPPSPLSATSTAPLSTVPTSPPP